MSSFGKIGGPLWNNGPVPGQFYQFPNGNTSTSVNTMPERKHDGGLITTGTSVIGIKFQNGVIIAADKLISYGKMSRFQNVDRVFKINDQVIIGVGGDYADFQFMKRLIDQLIINDDSLGDNNKLKPKSLFTYMTRVFYNRRSRMQPLWLDVVVGGIENGEPFLGHVNVRGKSYTSNCVGTGFGNHLAIPLFREVADKPHPNISQQQAENLIKKSMEVLYYRDCVAYPKFSQAISTLDGVDLMDDLAVDENWQVANMISHF